ncbi:MAG TPA: hypothetical protein VMY35_13660 [Phycisphaerae bacterium]|nr:hypothetical protein [Phycisphaerae bacterium]
MTAEKEDVDAGERMHLPNGLADGKAEVWIQMRLDQQQAVQDRATAAMLAWNREQKPKHQAPPEAKENPDG